MVQGKSLLNSCYIAAYRLINDSNLHCQKSRMIGNKW